MEKKILKTIADIKNLKIQGATNIVLTIISTLKDYLTKSVKENSNQFIVNFFNLTKELVNARPTEPYAQNLYFFLKGKKLLKNKKNFNLFASQALTEYQNFILHNEKNIINNGVLALKSYNNILTHCHSSTVVKIIKASYKKNKKIKIFADETRPLYQGRLTVKNLAKVGINVTQITDSASGFLISPYSGKNLMMDAIIVGADAIKPDGSIINKIGTYDIAASCYLNKIPFFVAASLLKYDLKNNIKIEIRSDKEIWPSKPSQVKILNFAFDLVPAKFITGIITEVGIIKPQQVKVQVKKIYPWLQLKGK